MSASKLESAKDACRRLNVSAQTLYAYVSRGLIRTAPHPGDSRKRQYSSIDISHLIERQNNGRSRQSIAHSTIDFGEPVLQSKISMISHGNFYYRGTNAVELSKTKSLEDIFELLCDFKVACKTIPNRDPFISNYRHPLDRFIDALGRELVDNKSYGNKNHAYNLLKLMADNASQQQAHGRAIHEQLADAWSSDSSAPDLIRRALVLCADHELNASTYATRITASAGASLSACLLTGISTLSGQHHGGITDRCVSWMRKSSEKTIGKIDISTKQPPPGFGHKLYPEGDPRTTEILSYCAPPESWAALSNRVIEITGAYPTLDFGLATLEYQLELPKGAGFSIFAVGRTAGWLAHCFEQRRDGRLIRPRASD